jgi:hypothetical protein
MANPEALAPDPLLVEPCLARGQDACRDLYDHHHARLLDYADRLLWPTPGWTEDSEDVAARLWCDLVVGRRRGMDGSDPDHGRTGAFLAAVARQQLRRLSRAALRPGRALAPRPEGDIAVASAHGFPGRKLLEEFVATLTPAEQHFYRERLLTRAGERDRPLVALEEELRRRVVGKFLRYLAGE